MAPFKAVLLAFFAHGSLVWPAVLQPRDQTISQCNADNCLRQIRSNSVKASPYCTSYLTNAHPVVYPVTMTSYTTVVPTVFHVGTGTAKSDYVTRKLTPYTPPGQKKRALTDGPVPTAAPALELRQAALPTFASSCGNSDRLSSACTCLIGNAPVTTTKTVPQNYPNTYRTVGVCGATDTPYYELYQEQGGFETYYNKAKIQFAEDSSINNLNACCSKCYHSPEWSASPFSLNPPPFIPFFFLLPKLTTIPTPQRRIQSRSQ
ncbi:MAG: hypothetical protein Q9190_000166 [Brigantiaea leucoxantha]